MASTITSEAQILGTSSVLRDAVRHLASVARVHQLPVLIEGGNRHRQGTGRPARAPAQPAPRPFLAINCSAIPTDLLESELFATRAGPSLARPTNMLGSSSGRTVGPSSWTRSASCRWPCSPRSYARFRTARFVVSAVATCARSMCGSLRRPTANLGEMVAARTFREDLFYRLSPDFRFGCGTVSPGPVAAPLSFGFLARMYAR